MDFKTTGVDWLNFDIKAVLGAGDGLSPSIERLGGCISNAVQLSDKPLIRPCVVDYNAPRKSNSGFEKSDIDFRSSVPSWAYLEMLKQDNLQASWRYANGKSISSTEIAKVLLDASLSSIKEQDLTVIAIPEETTSFGQENLIRSFKGGRSKVRLLWRSIAAVLGLTDDYRDYFEEGESIAVFDFQPHGLNITLLDLKSDFQNEVEQVVPVRHVPDENCFKFAPLPPLEFIISELLLHDNEINYDIKSIWYIANALGAHLRIINTSCPVPAHTGYEMISDFTLNNPVESDCYQLNYMIWPEICESIIKNAGGDCAKYTNRLYPSSALSSIESIPFEYDYALLCGPYLRYMDRSQLKERFDCDFIWVEGDDAPENLIATGCSIFGLRSLSGLPTYFDELLQLEMLVQDPEEEDIVPKMLIEGGVARGNMEFKLDEPLTGFAIDKDNANCRFYLQMEGKKRLRELIQEFNVKLSEREPLELTPTMIPAQGMAQVEVRNDKSFKRPVLLDWEKMEVSEKTITDLKNEIERSFPPYIPLVKADYWKFNDIEWHIERYANDGYGIDHGWLNSLGAIGKDVTDDTGLARINVFGNDPAHTTPENASDDLIESFLERLQMDYDRGVNYRHVIRAIAWTYQSDFFEAVRYDLVQKLSDYEVLSLPEQTACANFFRTKSEFQTYFKRVLYEFSVRGSDGMNGYVNCLKKMLSYNNDMLADISTENAYRMMEYLNNMFVYGDKYSKPNIFNNAITTTLFMLKRRKYDRCFIPYSEDVDTQDDLLKLIISNLEIIINNASRDFSKRKMIMTSDGSVNLAEEILKFLKGKGNASGIPGAL